MSDPTVSTYWNQTTPAVPSGDQACVVQSDNATPQDSRTIYPQRMVGDSGSGGSAGTVPPPAAGDGAAKKWLKATGAWLAIVASDLVGAVFGASGSGHSVGAVPDPGASAGTTKYLREDATWAAPGTTLTLEHDGTANGSQTLLNLKHGSGILLTDDGVGGVTIAAGSMVAGAFVQGNKGFANADSKAVAYTSANTAGNCLIAAVMWNDWFIGFSTLTVSDSNGNTWTRAVQTTNGAQHLEVWVALNCAAGANTVTAAASPSASQHVIGLAIHEYSGIAIASAVDATNTAINNGVNTLSTTVSPTVAGEMLFVMAGYESPLITGTASCSPGTGPRETVNATGGSDTLNFSTFDATLSSSGSTTVTTTYGSSGPSQNSIVAVTLKSATLTTGTVTSVGLTVPSRQSVSGSPIVGAGTFAITDNNESANTVFAGPTSGSAAAPTFRVVVAADLPAMVGDTGSGGTKGAAPAPGAGDAAAGKFLKADGTYAVPPGTGGASVMVGSGTGHAAGLAPDPGATAGSTKFLREDATWAVPAGGGGGGSTVPALSSFTWVNQGSSTAIQNGGSSSPILMQIADSSSLNWRGLFVAQPSTPYKVIAQIRMATGKGLANSQAAGLYFYDGTKLFGLEFLAQTAGIQMRALTLGNVNGGGGGSTLLSGTQTVNQPQSAFYAPLWIQLRNSGTTLYVDYGYDGSNFINFYSQAVGTFLTPTQIGFGGISVASDSTNYVLNSLLSWATVGNATL